MSAIAIYRRLRRLAYQLADRIPSV